MHLRNQAEVLRRLQIKLAIGLVLIALAAWFFGARPMTSQIEASVRTETDLREQLGQTLSRTGQLPELRRDIAELRRMVERYKPLPVLSELPVALAEIGRLGSLADVRKWDRKHVEPVKLESCIEQPFQISFEGETSAVLGLIHQLETMDRLSRVRELSIRQADARTGELSVSLSMSLFFKEER